jgi:hypothetical protein
MKKLSYDTLIKLLDDEEISIQEQALIIFRCLIVKTCDDVEEVLSNCKARLLIKLEEKINSSNEEIVIHTLYVIANLASGNDKHKIMVINFFSKYIKKFLVIFSYFYFYLYFILSFAYYFFLIFYLLKGGSK